VYRGWDASGRLLNILSNGKKVIIRPQKNELSDINELKKVLRKHLKEISKEIDKTKENDLDFLLQQADFFLFKPRKPWEIIRLFFSDFLRTLFSKPIHRNLR